MLHGSCTDFGHLPHVGQQSGLQLLHIRQLCKQLRQRPDSIQCFQHCRGCWQLLSVLQGQHDLPAALRCCPAPLVLPAQDHGLEKGACAEQDGVAGQLLQDHRLGTLLSLGADHDGDIRQLVLLP